MSDNSDNGTGPFFDAFRNFGRNLKLPSVTIEDVVSHHKKNIQALEAAAKNTSEGAQAIMAQQRKTLENTLADITHMDDQIGLFFQLLKERGLWEDLVIVVMGDHGEGLGQHGLPGHSV